MMSSNYFLLWFFLKPFDNTNVVFDPPLYSKIYQWSFMPSAYLLYCFSNNSFAKKRLFVESESILRKTTLSYRAVKYKKFRMFMSKSGIILHILKLKYFFRISHYSQAKMCGDNGDNGRQSRLYRRKEQLRRSMCQILKSSNKSSEKKRNIPNLTPRQRQQDKIIG